MDKPDAHWRAERLLDPLYRSIAPYDHLVVRLRALPRRRMLVVCSCPKATTRIRAGYRPNTTDFDEEWPSLRDHLATLGICTDVEIRFMAPTCKERVDTVSGTFPRAHDGHTMYDIVWFCGCNTLVTHGGRSMEPHLVARMLKAYGVVVFTEIMPSRRLRPYSTHRLFGCDHIVAVEFYEHAFVLDEAHRMASVRAIDLFHSEFELHHGLYRRRQFASP